MAYTAPKRWAHGEEPLAADMNKYSDSLEALHDYIGDVNVNPAVLCRYTLVNGSSFPESPFSFFHRHRYLIYRSDNAPTLTDPDDADNSATLAADSNYSVYDLSQLSWITPGKLYVVDDCIWAYEDYTP